MTDTAPVPLNKTWNEADIVAHFIEDRTTRDAAEWLNENISAPEYKITHSTVSNWTEDIHAPGWHYLYAYTFAYPAADPRHQMAAALIERRIAEIGSLLKGSK